MNVVEVSIKRPIFIFMVTLFFIVIGAMSLGTLPVDLYPDVSYPVLSVRANLDGAAPQEMEELVTKPLEDNLSSLAGVTTIRSFTREGASSVVLEFDSGADIKFQEMQVRAKVANMRRSLPEDLSEPVVMRQDPDDTPIIELAVTGNRTSSELTRLVDEEIAERIRQLPGVGEVDLGGERKREILVELKAEAMDAWKISIAQVIQGIRDFSGNDPIGKLKGQERTWLVRSISSVKGVHDLSLIPVAKNADGRAVLLGELANISEGFSEVNRISRLSDGKTLKATIDLDIKKQSGENTVKVSGSILSLIDTLKKELPADIQITMIRDNAELVRTNVADVFETLIIGALLTIAVVLLFLRSPRATLTTGISLPSSIITTFAVMAVAGFTINVMTLLALSLAIGLLVDDAIVVRENIFRHLQKNDKDPIFAATVGTKEVSLAVVATTATIVAVFLPVGFMGGTTGQFFKQFAVTVVFAILISLWDALTMAPMLSAYFANISDPAREWLSLGKWGPKIYAKLEKFEHLFVLVETKYAKILQTLVAKPSIALSVSTVALAIAVIGFTFIGKGFLPAQLGEVFSASLSGPLAVPIEQVNALADQVNDKIKTVKGLEYWSLRAGSSGSGNASINMTARVKQEFASSQSSLAEVRASLRKTLEGIVGYRVRISEPSDPLAGSSGRFQPLAVLISGADGEILRQIARQILKTMDEVEGITDLSPLQEEGLPELQLHTEPNLAGHFGVTPNMISNELHTWIEGNTSNNLQLGSERIPIRVRLQGGENLTAPSLLAKSIFSQNRSTPTAIPLSSTVTLKAGASPAVIVRENRQRIIRVGGGLEQGAALATVVARLEKKLKEIPLPDGYKASIVGQSQQMSELFSNIFFALLLGCLFMYMILASLFESFLQPLTVMAAVPLAATGAVLALLMFGLPLDLYGGIGMILLAGIVAKNSILLVDFAMQRLKDHNEDPATAILNSAPLRLRPIIMTSLAMIAGMLPVATGLGVGGAARQGLGVATIGGIISSTFLTLLVVPSLFIAVEKFKKKAERFRTARLP